MTAKIKVIRARDFLQITETGDMDLSSSLQILLDVADARRPPADFGILLDLRRAQWRLSTVEIYELAKSLAQLDNLRGAKIAVLVLSGANFDAAQFFETCSVNIGGIIDCFTNFEDAIQWFFESLEITDETPNQAMDTDKK